MAETDPLDVLTGLTPEALSELIRKQNAALVDQSEARRNAPGVDWSQPFFWPLSVGNDPETGEMVGMDFVMPQMVSGALDAYNKLFNPGDTPQTYQIMPGGFIAPFSDEQIGAGWELAGNVTGLGTATAFPKAVAQGFDPNLLSIFAGTNAKTADLPELRNAMSIVRSMGKDGERVTPELAEFIFSRTGWFPGPDGKWRFEIPDNVTLGPVAPNVEQDAAVMLESLLERPMASLDLNDPFDKLKLIAAQMQMPAAMSRNYPPVTADTDRMLNHPELFKAYPELAEKPMSVGWRPGQEGVNYHDPAIPIEAYGPTERDVLSVILHELQHSVQNIEGFARGGNPKWMKNVLANLAPTADQQLLYPTPDQMYRALMGEVEARTVQSRYELGKALENPETAAAAADMGWQAAPGKTTPYFRDPEFRADETGSYDIPYYLQLDPALVLNPDKKETLQQKLLRLKTALAGGQ